MIHATRFRIDQQNRQYIVGFCCNDPGIKKPKSLFGLIRQRFTKSNGDTQFTTSIYINWRRLFFMVEYRTEGNMIYFFGSGIQNEKKSGAKRTHH